LEKEKDFFAQAARKIREHPSPGGEKNKKKGGTHGSRFRQGGKKLFAQNEKGGKSTLLASEVGRNRSWAIRKRGREITSIAGRWGSLFYSVEGCGERGAGGYFRHVGVSAMEKAFRRK